MMTLLGWDVSAGSDSMELCGQDDAPGMNVSTGTDSMELCDQDDLSWEWMCL